MGGDIDRRSKIGMVKYRITSFHS